MALWHSARSEDADVFDNLLGQVPVLRRRPSPDIGRTEEVVDNHPNVLPKHARVRSALPLLDSLDVGTALDVARQRESQVSGNPVSTPEIEKTPFFVK